MRLFLFCCFFALLIISCKNESKKQEKTFAQKEVHEEEIVSHGAKFFPIDEAGKDTSFFNFRDRFLKAILAGDEKSFLPKIDENIRTGFGKAGGKEHFVKLYSENNYARFRKIMKRILANGGSFRSDSFALATGMRSFSAPYVYSNWPDSLDPFSHIAIIGKMVQVWEKPGVLRADSLMLSYEIVRTDFNASLPRFPTDEDREKFPNGGKEWYYIETLDGEIQGFVRDENVYSPFAYRAIFGKNGHDWKLQVFVAGD